MISPLDFNAGAMPEQAAVVDMSEQPSPQVPNGVPAAPPLPPSWPDLEAALVDVDDEDKSHAVEAWRELVVQNGRQLPDWSGTDEQGVKGFTDEYQDKIKADLKFDPKGKPFRHLANEIAIDPMRPADGLNEAWRAGLIEKPTLQDYKTALDIQAVTKENADLMAAAGANQEGKALAVGAGRGAAFLAGATATGAAFAPTGAATYGIAPLLAGAVGGTIATMGYDELLSKVAENNKTIESFAASSKLHPNWTAGGELVSFAIPAPLGVARGVRRFQLVAENLGGKEALKQAAKYVAVSGGVGAASAPVMAALDRFKNAALDLDVPEASLFDPKSIAANVTLAIMLGNLGVKFTKYNQVEAASIHQRGMAGEKLNPAEAEVFRTINRAIAKDPKKFVFEVEQATMGGKPLDGAVAARTQSGKPTGAAAGGPQPQSGPTPGATGAAGATGSSAQQGQRSAKTGATGSASTGGASQQSSQQGGSAGQAAPKARRFWTQQDFDAFMDQAQARGDADAAGLAWAIHNAANEKNFFVRWVRARQKSGDPDVALFAQSVLNGHTSEQYAAQLAQRSKGGNQGNGPEPKGQPASSATSAKPSGAGSTSAESRPGASTPEGRRPGDFDLRSPERTAVAGGALNESLGQNTPGGLGTALAGALPGPAVAAASAGIALSPVVAGGTLTPPTAQQVPQDETRRVVLNLATSGAPETSAAVHQIANLSPAPSIIPPELEALLAPDGANAPTLPSADPEAIATDSPLVAPAPSARLNFSPKKKAGIRAIKEILSITGDQPEPGKSLYVIADAEGVPMEVFTNAIEGHQHLQSMASRDEWLWSMPSDYNGPAVLEGGLAPKNHPKDRSGPLKDPFGNRFKGEVPANGSRTPAPIESADTEAPAKPSKTSETAFKGKAIVELPISKLKLSEDVPQFKGGANDKGVTEPLEGTFDRTGVSPIQVWERNNGDLEVISGRHRFDLAQRSGEETIPSQVHREKDGFTPAMAARLDAELNIRDGHGEVSDYANYFRNSKISKEAAESGGLLARAQGQAGFSIGNGASDDVFALHQSGKLTDAQARAIADAAPGDAPAQAIGTRAALDGKGADYIRNLIKAAQARVGDKKPSATTGDLFNFDDSAIVEMEAQAKAASAEQKAIREKITAAQGASKRPEVARKLGVDVSNPAETRKRLEELKADLERWDNWPLHSDLVAITRREVTPKGVKTTLVVDTPKAAPKLRQGEKQGDLLSTQTEDLTLAGEKGADTLKAAADKEAAERAAAEAKKIQDRDQGSLFETQPKANQNAPTKAENEAMQLKAVPDLDGNLPAGVLEDVVDFGDRVLTDEMDFGSWAAAMIDRLGEKVAPALHNVWEELTFANHGGHKLGGKRDNVRNETGAIFGRARRARGRQPDALPEEERILSTRAFWEGSADAFLGHPTFRPLGRAINKQVDLVDKRLGDTTGKLVAWESRTNRSDREDAKATLSQYIDARESGRLADARAIRAGATPAAKDLIKTVEEIAQYTGRVSTTLVQPSGRVGVEVMDGGTPRPLRDLGKEFWPRILKGEYDAALRDPLSNPALWQQMRQDLVANGNVATIAEADQFLKGGGNNDAANEFLGSLYRARAGRMPAHWYDTSLEGFANWATRWADIVSKIEAFGQKIRPDDTDAFDDALRLTTHAPTRSYINSVRARAYNERNVGFMAKYFMDAPRLLASGLFLTNPVTIGVNYVSAKVMNTFTYGLAATHLRNPLAKFSTQNHLDAHALGVLKADMVRLLYRDDMPGLDAMKSFVNGAMKFSGYEAVENLTRVDTYLTALSFLHSGLAAVRKNPESSASVAFMAFLKRNKFDVGAIIRENGRGDATDTFLRTTIKDAQGGYAYNQVPWWTDTPLGKLLLQFSKFGTQLTRNVMRNVIRPAFAMDTVTFRVNGKTVTKRHWDVRPLLYLIAGSVAAGEGINILKELGFGIERKDATIDEIAYSMKEDARDGLALIGTRILNDMITLGTLGIFGTPVQTVRDIGERSRYRDPLAPPGVSLLSNVTNLLKTAWEQKQLTGRDVRDFLASSLSMYRYADAFVKEQAHNLGAKWDAAELKIRADDVSFLRSVSNRYAQDVELPAQKITSAGRKGKDELTPMRADLMEALLMGHQEQAKQIVADYLAEFPSIAEKKEKLRSLATVVSNNQPARVGGIAGNERRVEFMEWAKKRLAAKDLARIQAVDEVYRTTANAIGLMKLNSARDDMKVLREAAKDELEKSLPATPSESERFIESSLKPQGRKLRLGGFH